MTPENPIKELRIKRGSHILGYIRQFSATEKVIFSLISLILIGSSLTLLFSVRDMFAVEVPAYGGTIHEGLVGLPRTINPVIALSDVDKDLGTLVYSGLMRYSDGHLVPDIAKSYKVSDDGLVYTFTLKDKVYFQDGEPLTADDVVYTIEKIQDPILKSPRHADWSNVTIKKLSPTQVEFSLKQPYGPFLNNTTVGILPKHIWSNVSNDQFIFSSYNVSPIGSGPYKIDSITRDNGGIPTQYTMSTWGKYSGKEPFIDKIIFDFFSDEEKSLQALDAGNIDSLPSISSVSGERLASDSGQNYTVISAPLPRIFGIFLNQNQNTILTNKAVRQALGMTINKQAIVDKVLHGYANITNSPLPLGIVDNAKDNDLNIAQAENILKKDGWMRNANGTYEKKSAKSATTTLSLTLYTTNVSDLEDSAHMVVADWKKFGINVDLKVLDQNDLYQNIIRPRKYDALLFGELIGRDRDLYAFWHSSQRIAPGLNIAMYTNSSADSILSKIRAGADEKTIKDYYNQLDSAIKSDMPAIFLYVPDFIYAIPKSLHGVNINDMTTQTDRFNDIDKWYLETDKVLKIFLKNNK